MAATHGLRALELRHSVDGYRLVEVERTGAVYRANWSFPLTKDNARELMVMLSQVSGDSNVYYQGLKDGKQIVVDAVMAALPREEKERGSCPHCQELFGSEGGCEFCAER